MVWGQMKTGYGRTDTKMVRMLLDSGASGSRVSKKVVNKLRLKKEQETAWTTAAGKHEY